MMWRGVCGGSGFRGALRGDGWSNEGWNVGVLKGCRDGDWACRGLQGA